MTEKLTMYFHLGLPKTASTYLQKVVFPQLRGVVFYKKHDFKRYRTISALPGKKYLFSSEMDRGIEAEMQNIKTFHPSASLILVFRSHFSWILSKYKYSIRKWNGRVMADYYSTEDDKVLSVPEDYYRSIVQLADKIFEGRVLVLNYHDLKARPGHIEREICAFMGLSQPNINSTKTVNKAFSKRQLIHLRKYNQIHRYKESRSKYRFIKKLHYRYRQYVLHIVAFIARFIPADIKGFDRELKKEKALIEARYKEDWAFILSRTNPVRV